MTTTSFQNPSHVGMCGVTECVTLKFICWNRMVLGNGVFGEVIRSWVWGLHNWISVCILFLSVLREHGTRYSFANQTEGSHQQPNLAALWFWTWQPPGLCEIHISCLSSPPPVCGIFGIVAIMDEDSYHNKIP